MEVDIEKLNEQRKEEILKSEKYIKFEFVIGNNDENPVSDIEAHHASIEMMAKTIVGLEEILKDLKRNSPETYLYAKLFLNCSSKIIRKKKEDK